MNEKAEANGMKNSFRSIWQKALSGLFISAALIPLVGHAQQDFDEVEIQTLRVQGNVYMLVGAGGNITLQVGDDGVLIVDTMFEPLADKVYAAIRELSDGPIRYIVNTHSHGDHIGGNAALGRRGSSITGGNSNEQAVVTGNGAKILAHENVVNNILNADMPVSIEKWPTETYFSARKDLFFNGEAVVVTHQPNAHTDGDSFVFFRRSDVVSAGDIFNTTGFPYIDVNNGGSLQGIIAALNNLLTMAVPADRQEGGTMIIPGHGRLTDEADVLEYRDMLTIIRDRIAYRIDQGDSLVQVIASQPTLGYDTRYGSDAGFWTTNRFIEAVYNELSVQEVIAGGSR